LTAVLEQADTESVTGDDTPVASWPSRAGAFTIDVLFGVPVLATLALVALTTPRYGWLWWLSIVVGGLVFLVIALNRLLLPAMRGWSLGRAQSGIAVVRRDGSAPGPWRLLARDLAHLLDTAALFIGWLWPLWDARKRTFADLLLATEVRVSGGRPNVRRVVAAVLAAGAVIAAAAAGLTYLTGYRHEQGVDAARSQIAEAGPKIVEQILTYNAGSMKDDFARAQSLVTDDYRKQLVQQQQAVEKKAAASNDYFAVTSSVLSADTDKATMLVFLQGQRQAQQQDVKFITATARVAFAKSADGKWRVSKLDVLPGPVFNRGGK
jgi:Mce-associated membrane protein